MHSDLNQTSTIYYTPPNPTNSLSSKFTPHFSVTMYCFCLRSTGLTRTTHISMSFKPSIDPQVIHSDSTEDNAISHSLRLVLALLCGSSFMSPFYYGAYINKLDLGKTL